MWKFRLRTAISGLLYLLTYLLYFVVWDAAARFPGFRGRGQAPRVPWLYGAVLYEYTQRQSCKAFTGLSIRTKTVRGGRLLLRENLAETDPPIQKRRFPINIRS